MNILDIIPLRIRQRRREAMDALAVLAQQRPHAFQTPLATASAPRRTLGREDVEDEGDVFADERAVHLETEREVGG